MRKAFAFDIDGTFLNDKHQVQQSHIDAVQKATEKGHVVALCSGRPYFDMIPVLEQMPKNSFRYLICNNGAYVMDLQDGKKIMDEEVPKDIINDFREVAKIAKFGFAVHTLDSVSRGVFWDSKDEEPEWFTNSNENMEEKSKYFISWEEAKEKAMNEKISQLSLIGTKEDIQKALDSFKKNEHEVDIHIAGEIYLDVNPNGVSKIKGVETLSKMINIPVKDFVVFGDSGNDLQMLKGAGLGVAMGNATQEAKNAADIVIGDNNTSAIADKILELI